MYRFTLQGKPPALEDPVRDRICDCVGKCDTLTSGINRGKVRLMNNAGKGKSSEAASSATSASTVDCVSRTVSKLTLHCRTTQPALQ